MDYTQDWCQTLSWCWLFFFFFTHSWHIICFCCCCLFVCLFFSFYIRSQHQNHLSIIMAGLKQQVNASHRTQTVVFLETALKAISLVQLSQDHGCSMHQTPRTDGRTDGTSFTTSTRIISNSVESLYSWEPQKYHWVLRTNPRLRQRKRHTVRQRFTKMEGNDGCHCNIYLQNLL